MEKEQKIQKGNLGSKPRKKVKLDPLDSPSELKKQKRDEDVQEVGQNDSDSSSGWSSEVIEPAIKSMSFRKRRGTRMKDLMKGKHRKDNFWDKYQNYFGGDLDRPQDQSDLEDYEASSSGRDEFDSDFDLTDSYVGKRGRKKGTKVKRRKRKDANPPEKKEDEVPKPKGKRGRKKKVPVEPQPQQKSQILLKEERQQVFLQNQAPLCESAIPESKGEKSSALGAHEVIRAVQQFKNVAERAPQEVQKVEIVQKEIMLSKQPITPLGGNEEDLLGRMEVQVEVEGPENQ